MNFLNANLYNEIVPERRKRRRTYRLRQYIGNASYSDEDIRNCFRFRRGNIDFLINLLYDDLLRPTKRYLIFIYNFNFILTLKSLFVLIFNVA